VASSRELLSGHEEGVTAVPARWHRGRIGVGGGLTGARGQR
jgi:hypothetical protein